MLASRCSLEAAVVGGRVDADLRLSTERNHGITAVRPRRNGLGFTRPFTRLRCNGDRPDRDLIDAEVTAAETRTNEVVWQARPVRVRTVTAEEARGLGLEPPIGAAGGVRLVEADGFDVQPCGGTHPRSTAEVGVVAIVGRERYKGGSRIRFLCGHRVLSAFRQRTQVLDRLGALLSSPLASLAENAERQSAQLAEAERRSRDLLDRALDGDARRLLAAAGTPPAVVVAVYDAWAPADLRALAQRLVALAPCVALLGSRAEKAHLVFDQSEGLPHDIPALLREAMESLGGRGGGKGNLAQGGGDRLDGLEEALDRAAARVRGTAGRV